MKTAFYGVASALAAIASLLSSTKCEAIVCMAISAICIGELLFGDSHKCPP